MHYGRQVTVSFFIPAVVLSLMLFVGFSCVIPKKYPHNKPFVYRTEIKINAKMKLDQRQDLIARLENQLDDSLQVKTTTELRLAPPFFYKQLLSPPAFDSSNIGKSITYMNYLLNSMGYYSPVIKDSIKFEKKKAKICTIINFTVTPGTRLVLDSVGFDLQDPELQQLVTRAAKSSLLKKGDPYSKQTLAAELSRLVDTIRNNGYYKFSKEDLYIEHDTVAAALIDPTLDPLEQGKLLEALKKRKENPTINVVFKQRAIHDSSHLTRYYIGNVTVYPDLPTTEDSSLIARTDTTVIRKMTFISRTNKFKLPFIANNIFLRPDGLYKQGNYFRTSDRLGGLPAWQFSNIDFTESELADSLLDVTIKMYPAKKQNLNISLEASRNSNEIVSVSNLFGLGLNLALQNRNAFKSSVHTTTNLRGGVEFGGNFIQTRVASISHSIAFPELILPFDIAKENKLKGVQTILNVSAGYTDRRLLYNLRSIDGSWGYQLTRNNKTYIIKIPNIEYNTVSYGDSLQEIFVQNPSLKLAFRPGLIVGSQFFYSSIKKKENRTNIFRFSAEESGALLGFIKSLDENSLFRFIKGDMEYVHNIELGKTQLVMRAYGGAGLAYGRQGSGYETTLPFFKAFFAGGPNTMRGWQVRRLGLGSAKFYNDTPYTLLDRFGDIKLEGNVEFRFPLGTLFGVKLKSALYTDVGNIWNRKPIDTSAEAVGSDFQINRFYKEFAVDVGTGLRLDFTYFLIRLDWAYIVRDPQRLQYPNRWFYNMTIGNGQFQLGINYPF